MTHPPIKAPFELPQTEAAALVALIESAPVHIWLDLGENLEALNADAKFRDLSEVTWSEDNATGCGIKYARADTLSHPAAQAGAVQAVGDDKGGMTIAKALRQGLRAEPWVSNGPGRPACVGICAIQLEPWTHTDESAKAFADAYNAGADHMRNALAATQPSAAPGDGQGVEPVRKAWKITVPSGLSHWFTEDDDDVAHFSLPDQGHKIEEYHLAAPGAAIAAREQESPAQVAVNAIAAQTPQLEDSVHGPRRRCQHCGHAWQTNETEHHATGCAYVIATSVPHTPLASPAAAPTSQPNAAAQEQQAGAPCSDERPCLPCYLDSGPCESKPTDAGDAS